MPLYCKPVYKRKDQHQRASAFCVTHFVPRTCFCHFATNVRFGLIQPKRGRIEGFSQPKDAHVTYQMNTFSLRHERRQTNNMPHKMMQLHPAHPYDTPPTAHPSTRVNIPSKDVRHPGSTFALPHTASPHHNLVTGQPPPPPARGPGWAPLRGTGCRA